MAAPGGRSLPLDPACPPASRGRALALCLLAGALSLAVRVPAAPAADWGSIVPGVSTTETVREQWGAPSKETRAKVEGFDTVQWLYEAARAPAGLKTMTVDFGLLTPGGYKPTVVRLLTLEPHPAIFGVNTVIQGWGEPDGIRGKDKENLSFFYQDGLLVSFDKEDFAFRMIFSVPQPGPPAIPSGPAQRPSGAAPAPAPGPPTQRR